MLIRHATRGPRTIKNSIGEEILLPNLMNTETLTSEKEKEIKEMFLRDLGRPVVIQKESVDYTPSETIPDEKNPEIEKISDDDPLFEEMEYHYERTSEEEKDEIDISKAEIIDHQGQDI